MDKHRRTGLNVRHLLYGTAAVLAMAPISASALTLHLPGLEAGGTLPQAQVFNQNGCKGQNISPKMVWSGAPRGTQSFAVTLFDPDARFIHWATYNIPPQVMNLPAGAADGGLPAGAWQGTNNFGLPGYGGACPPPGGGLHHYVFTVYALNVPGLGLTPGVADGAIIQALARHILAKGQVVLTYGRK